MLLSGQSANHNITLRVSLGATLTYLYENGPSKLFSATRKLYTNTKKKESGAT